MKQALLFVALCAVVVGTVNAASQHICGLQPSGTAVTVDCHVLGADAKKQSTIVGATEWAAGGAENSYYDAKKGKIYTTLNTVTNEYYFVVIDRKTSTVESSVSVGLNVSTRSPVMLDESQNRLLFIGDVLTGGLYTPRMFYYSLSTAAVKESFALLPNTTYYGTSISFRESSRTIVGLFSSTVGQPLSFVTLNVDDGKTEDVPMLAPPDGGYLMNMYYLPKLEQMFVLTGIFVAYNPKYVEFLEYDPETNTYPDPTTGFHWDSRPWTTGFVTDTVNNLMYGFKSLSGRPRVSSITVSGGIHDYDDWDFISRQGFFLADI